MPEGASPSTPAAGYVAVYAKADGLLYSKDDAGVETVVTNMLGTNVGTFLATPSSTNLAAAVTDETGSGALVFATSPTLVTPALGTPSSGVTDNLTTTTTATALTDTDFVDTNLAAGGKRKILWTAVKTYLNGVFGQLTGNLSQFASGGAIAPASINGVAVDAAANKPVTAASLNGGTLPASVTTLAISAAISDNDSDTSGATTAFVQSQIENNNNPTAIAQSINMTEAASGSNGIQVADNANIDFGTGNFTLHWEGSLPDWTPSALVRVIYRYEDSLLTGYALTVNTNGAVYVSLWLANTTPENFFSTATAATDGTAHKITAVITRETASTDGSVVFYADGIQLGAAVAITARTPPNLDCNAPLYILGRPTIRYVGSAKSTYTFNRALSAAQVLDLCRNGVAYADKGASQTTLNVSSMVQGTFDSASGLSATGGTFTKSTAGTKNCGTADEILFILGKTYIAEYDAEFTGNITGAYLFLKGSVGGANWGVAAPTAVSGHNVSAFVCTTGGTGVVSFAVPDAVGTAGNLIISNLKVYAAGATLELTSEGIQPEPGQWFDSSGNKQHAKMPIEGATTTRRKKEFEVRWSNTWAGTHEAQYLGGVNEAILPSDNIRIESITMRCSATGVNVILGDGSATARWVASVALATYLDCTIANRNHDGTNRKLVIDPSANYTGTITTTIIGRILD